MWVRDNFYVWLTRNRVLLHAQVHDRWFTLYLFGVRLMPVPPDRPLFWRVWRIGPFAFRE